MRVWRICWARFAQAAFTGEGGVDIPGRWNPMGVPMVYTSSSRSLAAMEIFVHLIGAPGPEDFVIVGADLPSGKGTLERLDVALLPQDWQPVYSPELQTIGAKWIASRRSLALEVPSVVVRDEWNVLLNHAHPAFAKVKIGKAEPFSFNARMFGR
jgi:RES domain-containing protein